MYLSDRLMEGLKMALHVMANTIICVLYIVIVFSMFLNVFLEIFK